MLSIKSWRIYYADGSTFDSTRGRWADAPPFGVECIVYYHADERKTIYGGRDNGDIYEHAGEDGIKMGLWMDSEGFYRIYNLALQSSSP